MSYPNQILVSGHTLEYVNGIYTFDSLGVENKPIYIKDEAYVPPEGTSGPGLGSSTNPPRIFLQLGGLIRFWKFDYPIVAPWNPLLILPGGVISNQVVPSDTWPGDWPGDTTDPAITWNDQPDLTITEYTGPEPQPNGNGEESANTFGLPAETIALITSRFGTVANFLRLRNQGQV